MKRLITALFFAISLASPLRAQAGNAAVDKARALIQSEDLQGALGLLNQVRNQPPQQVEALYLRGYVLYRLRRLEEARTQLEEIVKAAPPAVSSRKLLGSIALLQNRPQQAIVWLQPVAAQNPPVYDAAAELGKAYFDTHQLEQAQNWTEKAIRLAPWDGALHYRLARIYQQTGREQQAASEFQKSVELKGADREAVQKLIQCDQDIAAGRKESALQDRDDLLKQDQLDPDVLVALGTTLANRGLAAEALPAFEQAALRAPLQFQTEFNLGLARLKLGRPSEAVEPLRKSLEISPQSVESNSALALCFVLLGRFGDALPPLELVHSLRPDNPKTEALLAIAYLRTGSASKALPVVKDALARQPSDPKLYFLLIECLNASEDQAGALTICERVVKQFPDLGKAHLAEAQQLARLGRYKEAGPSFAKAAELIPGDIEPLLGLAEAENKSGHYNDSLTSYRRALDLDRNNLTAQLGASRDMVALGNLQGAKDLLETASAAHAENAQVHIELARVYARLGSRDLAAEQTRISQELRARETSRPGPAQ